MASSQGELAVEHGEGWECPACTFRNLPLRPGCEQCSTSRPPSYHIPAGYQPTQEEGEILSSQELAFLTLGEVLENQVVEAKSEAQLKGKGNVPAVGLDELRIGAEKQPAQSTARQPQDKQLQADWEFAQEIQAKLWQNEETDTRTPPDTAADFANADENESDDEPDVGYHGNHLHPVLPIHVQPVHPANLRHEELSSLDRLIMTNRDFTEQDYEVLQRLEEQVGEAKERGMSQSQIEQLPRRTFVRRHDKKSNGPDEERPSCAACLEEFENQNKLLILPCGHELHSVCATKWLKERATCPVCYKDAKETEQKELPWEYLPT